MSWVGAPHGQAPKLLRLGRLFKLLARIEGAANIGRIVLLLGLLVLLVHWLAAIYFLLASGPHGALTQQLCGTTDSDAFRFFRRVPIELQPEPPRPLGCVPRTAEGELATYLLSYRATLLMLVGEPPDVFTLGEVVYNVLVVLIGACINATIFANVTSLVAKLTDRSAQHQAKMDAVDRAMRQLQLDKEITQRIRGFFNYRWARHSDHGGLT